jgi:ribose transport system substrate-binding protein
MKKMFFGTLCVTLLSVGFTCEGAANDEKSAPKATVPYSFAFLTNTLNNTYQSTMNDTLKRLATSHGDSYLALDPDYDVSKQVNQMLDVANKHVSLVFLIPVDSGGVHAGLDALQQAGIPVINIDTAVVEGDVKLVHSVVATDDYMAGKLDGEQMVQNHPNGGKIAILDFPENQSCVDRVQGFLAGLGASRSKFDIVAQQDGAAALDKSLPIAQDIIQAHPDLMAFFAINDPSAMGAIAAINATHRSGIEVYSIDGSPDGKAAILDGTMTADAAQVPIKEAEVAFTQALELLKTGKIAHGSSEIPEADVSYYTGQWKSNIEKATYLPSFLITKEIAQKDAGKWQ